MGAVISFILSMLVGESTSSAPAPIPPPADYEIKNPSTGLTGKQRLLIQSLWGIVVPDAKQHGVKFFIRLFTEFPGTQNMFSTFRGKEPASLHDNKRLAAHASTVMGSITILVDNLAETEILVEQLHKIAVNHHRRKQPVKYFNYVHTVLVAYLEDSLGSHWSKEAETAFDIMMTTIDTVIEAEYAKLDEASI